MNQKGLALSEYNESKGFAPILIILSIVLLLGVAGGAYYFGKLTVKAPVFSSQAPVTTSQTLISPTQPITKTIVSPTPTVADETANWKTYTNNKYGYSFKFTTNPNLKYYGCSMRVSGEKGEESFVMDEVSSTFGECSFGGYSWPISIFINNRQQDCNGLGYTTSQSTLNINGVLSKRCDKKFTGFPDQNQEYIKGPDNIVEVDFPLSDQYIHFVLTNLKYSETFDQILSTLKFTN